MKESSLFLSHRRKLLLVFVVMLGFSSSLVASDLKRLLVYRGFDGYAYFSDYNQIKYRALLNNPVVEKKLFETGRTVLYPLGSLEYVLLSQLALDFMREGTLNSQTAVGHILGLEFPEKLAHDGKILRVIHLLSNQTGVTANPLLGSFDRQFWITEQEIVANILENGIATKPGTNYGDPKAAVALLKVVLKKVAPNSLDYSLERLTRQVGLTSFYQGNYPAQRFTRARPFEVVGERVFFPDAIQLDRRLLKTSNVSKTMYADSQGIANFLKWLANEKRSILNHFEKEWYLQNTNFFGGFLRLNKQGRSYFKLLENNSSSTSVKSFIDLKSASLLFLISSQLMQASFSEELESVFNRETFKVDPIVEVENAITQFWTYYLGLLIFLLLGITVVCDAILWRYARVRSIRVTKLLPSLQLRQNSPDFLYVLNFTTIFAIALSFYADVLFTSISFAIVLLILTMIFKNLEKKASLISRGKVAYFRYGTIKQALFLFLAYSCLLSKLLA